MFTTLVAFVFALPLLGLAVPTPDASQCNTGTLQCCQSIQTTSSSAKASSWDDLLDVVTQGLGVPIGVGCTPINIIGVGGGSNCLATPACCESTNGSVGVNCNPINAPV